MHTKKANEAKRRTLSRFLGIVLIVLGIATIAAPVLFAPFRAKTLSMLLLGSVLVLAAIEQAVFATQSGSSGGISFRILVAVLYAAVGIAMLRMSGTEVLSLLPIVGALFVVDGIVEIVLAARLHLKYKGEVWLSASGILALSLGTVVFASGIIFLFLRSFPTAGAAWIFSMCIGIRLAFKGIEQALEKPAEIASSSNQKTGLRPAA